VLAHTTSVSLLKYNIGQFYCAESASVTIECSYKFCSFFSYYCLRSMFVHVFLSHIPRRLFYRTLQRLLSVRRECHLCRVAGNPTWYVSSRSRVQRLSEQRATLLAYLLFRGPIYKISYDNLTIILRQCQSYDRLTTDV